ncbi:MAG: hypothetical protein JWM10_2646 [Myxococcaceae bacterium]|nr:hypothetical protein [Myxococcaceae bacterium]
MAPRRPSPRRCAALWLSALLATLPATAQTPPGPRRPARLMTSADFPALRGVDPPAPLPSERLLAAGPVAALPLPDPSQVDARLRPRHLQLLAALRGRVRAVRAAQIRRATYPAMLARLRAMDREVTSLVALARGVAGSRDLALTTEALVLVGDAFEALAVQANRVVFEAPYHTALVRCGNGSVNDELEALLVELRSSPEPRPELARRALEIARQEMERRRQVRADYEANQRRGPRPTDLLGANSFYARVDLEIALVFFATAFQLALTHRSIAPEAWHALERMQTEENRPLLDGALAHQTLVADGGAFATMPRPGATLLESAALGPVALAP